MRRCTLILASLLCFAAIPLTINGCDQEVARSRDVDIKDDGTVKTEEKTVTRNADGSTTVTEEETVNRPGDPDLDD